MPADEITIPKSPETGAINHPQIVIVGLCLIIAALLIHVDLFFSTCLLLFNHRLFGEDLLKKTWLGMRISEREPSRIHATPQLRVGESAAHQATKKTCAISSAPSGWTLCDHWQIGRTSLPQH